MIVNPVWKREINISKVRLQLMMLEMQDEMINGAKVYGVQDGSKISGNNERQSANPVKEVRGQSAETVTDQRTENTDSGTNY